MKLLRKNIGMIAAVMTILILSLIAYGTYSVSTQGNRWIASGANTYIRQMKRDVIAGDIYDRNGIVLATTDAEGKRIYQEDAGARRAVVHVIGDSANNDGYGVESFKYNYQNGFSASYFQKLAHALRGEKMHGSNVTLSIDSNLSNYVASIFPAGKKGAVVVMNYATGELMSLQSFPSFDPNNITENVKTDPLQPFWNNATRWTSAPGSTFKIITLAAALKNIPGAVDKSFECSGELPVMDSIVRDAGNASHGRLSLKRAFAQSCNVTFANIALQMGDERLKEAARLFGTGDYFLFQDIVVEDSAYPTAGRSDKELAWTGVGQSALQMTPLHMTMIAGSIAYDGVMMEPRILQRAVTGNGEITAQMTPKHYLQPLDKTTADLICDYMVEAVRSGTGSRANVSGHRIAGKTGTAEIDGQEQSNAWFVGFIDEPQYPYAVCVVVMEGGGGGSVAAPIAGKIFSAITGASTSK